MSGAGDASSYGVHSEHRLPLALRLDLATQRLPIVTPGRLRSKLERHGRRWERSKEIVVAVGAFFFAFALVKVAVRLPRRNAEGFSFRPVTFGPPPCPVAAERHPGS